MGHYAVENWEIAILIFGLASLFAPFDLGKDRRKKKKRVARTMGKVIGHETQSSSSYDSGSFSPPTKHAVIAFKVKGKDYHCVSSTGASWIMHPVGTSLRVCYDPRDPSNAGTVPSDFETMLEIILIWGFPFVGIGCLTYLFIKYVF